MNLFTHFARLPFYSRRLLLALLVMASIGAAQAQRQEFDVHFYSANPLESGREVVRERVRDGLVNVTFGSNTRRQLRSRSVQYLRIVPRTLDEAHYQQRDYIMRVTSSGETPADVRLDYNNSSSSLLQVLNDIVAHTRLETNTVVFSRGRLPEGVVTGIHSFDFDRSAITPFNASSRGPFIDVSSASDHAHIHMPEFSGDVFIDVPVRNTGLRLGAIPAGSGGSLAPLFAWLLAASSR